MTKNNKGWELRMIDNCCKFDEAASSLQKMIRRGKEYEACWWAYLFHQSRYGDYLWRRLSIICSEDVGNGDPQTAILLNSLRNSWERLHKRIKEPILDKFLFFVQAILYMCRAKKSRENDSLSNLIDEHWKQGKRLRIPLVAVDPHCLRGKRRWGRFGAKDGKEKLRIKKWFSEWGKITNKAYPDKWEEKLKELWLKKAEEE